MRRVVVLPQPEGPSSEKNSPSSMARSRSATATTSSNRLTTPLSETAASVTCSSGRAYGKHKDRAAQPCSGRCRARRRPAGIGFRRDLDHPLLGRSASARSGPRYRCPAGFRRRRGGRVGGHRTGRGPPPGGGREVGGGGGCRAASAARPAGSAAGMIIYGLEDLGRGGDRRLGRAPGRWRCGRPRSTASTWSSRSSPRDRIDCEFERTGSVELGFNRRDRRPLPGRSRPGCGSVSGSPPRSTGPTAFSEVVGGDRFVGGAGGGLQRRGAARRVRARPGGVGGAGRAAC